MCLLLSLSLSGFALFCLDFFSAKHFHLYFYVFLYMHWKTLLKFATKTVKITPFKPLLLSFLVFATSKICLYLIDLRLILDFQLRMTIFLRFRGFFSFFYTHGNENGKNFYLHIYTRVWRRNTTNTSKVFLSFFVLFVLFCS